MLFANGHRITNFVQRLPKDSVHALLNTRHSFSRFWTMMAFPGTTQMRSISLNRLLDTAAQQMGYLQRTQSRSIWSFCRSQKRARVGERGSLDSCYETMRIALAFNPIIGVCVAASMNLDSCNEQPSSSHPTQTKGSRPFPEFGSMLGGKNRRAMAGILEAGIGASGVGRRSLGCVFVG
jgi:hypothetical protein